MGRHQAPSRAGRPRPPTQSITRNSKLTVALAPTFLPPVPLPYNDATTCGSPVSSDGFPIDREVVPGCVGNDRQNHLEIKNELFEGRWERLCQDWRRNGLQ